MQREIKGMFTRIYCEADYSRKAGAPQSDHLIIFALNWGGGGGTGSVSLEFIYYNFNKQMIVKGLQIDFYTFRLQLSMT